MTGAARQDALFVLPEDWAVAADLLAIYGREASGPQAKQMPPAIRDSINTAHEDGRLRQLVVALLDVVDGVLPGILGRADVQQALTLTAIASREEDLAPPLVYGPNAPN